MSATIRHSPIAPRALDEAKERQQVQREKNQAAIDLLDSWAEADEAEIREQIETWQFLKRALDEDRLSYRKFFE